MKMPAWHVALALIFFGAGFALGLVIEWTATQ